MKRKVILDPEADRDIEDEFNYLADRNVDAALRFLQATDDTFDDLAEIARRGQSAPVQKPQAGGGTYVAD